MTIVEFLTDRAAEREERADCIHDTGCGMHRYDGPCDCGEPERVRAAADATRQIADQHRRVWLENVWIEGPQGRYLGSTPVCRSCEPPKQFPEDAWPCPTLRLLALPDAEHSDYEERWRPERSA